MKKNRIKLIQRSKSIIAENNIEYSVTDTVTKRLLLYTINVADNTIFTPSQATHKPKCKVFSL